MTRQLAAKDERAHALALSYSDRESAHIRVAQTQATGLGPVAEEIIARARELGVPVHESRELVATLMNFDLDQRVPPALYVAVAQVLAWIDRLEHT
jgi:flagellar biosynthesis protein